MCSASATVEVARKKHASILQLLTHRVRLLTVQQVARVYFPDGRSPKRAAREALSRLADKRLVLFHKVMAHPEILLDTPVLRWHPNDQTPQFGRLAWNLRARWRQPPQATWIASATRQGRRNTQGPMGGRPIRTREVVHDIHVSALYLKLAAESPRVAESWVHEDAMTHGFKLKFGDKVPDAFIATSPPVAIDFGGRYSAEKVRAIHRGLCHMHYELW